MSVFLLSAEMVYCEICEHISAVLCTYCEVVSTHALCCIDCWTNSPYSTCRSGDVGRICCAKLITDSVYLRANTLLTYCEANKQVRIFE